MLIELLLHGVPKGQDFWGVKDDLIYIQNFYTSRTDKTRFLIQVRDVNDKRFCYYSYLKYNNIVDSSGRPGGYFGMTIRLDMYCSDIVSLYNIMDAVYKRYFVGAYLVEEQQRTKYLISDFSSKEKENREIFDAIKQVMNRLLSSSDFVGLHDFVSSNGGSVMEVNTLDCTKDNVAAVVKKVGSIALSPYYPSIKDKNIQQKIDEQIAAVQKSKNDELKKVKAECNERIARTSVERDTFAKEIDELKELLQKKTTEYSSLIADNKRLQDEFAQQKKLSEASVLIDSLREPLIKLSHLVGADKLPENRTIHTHHEKPKPKPTTFAIVVKTVLPVVNTVLLLLIVVWEFFCVSNDRSVSNNKKVYQMVNADTERVYPQKESRVETIRLKEETSSNPIDTLTIGEEYTFVYNADGRKCKWELGKVNSVNGDTCTMKVADDKKQKNIVCTIYDVETNEELAKREFYLKEIKK